MLHRLAGPAAATAVMAAACFASDFIDAERQLHARFGDDLHAAAPEAVSAAIVEMAESLPEFGAIDLPRCVPSGRLDFRSVADHLQITGGRDGEVILGGGQRGIQMLFSRLDLTIDRGAAVRPTPFELALAAGGRPADPDPAPPPRPRRVLRFENAAPASDLVALFCSGGIHIRNDIERCAWIAGDNAFGSRVVTADARVDDSLFLWFGLNWPFQDYNAHWDPKQADRDWSARPQMEFDCHGGGGGTRLYMMIETNYGNPAPGVVLRNVEGMALYHGSTERSSAQGPGTYWLKDCRRVQLGLRAINAFYPALGSKLPTPNRDLTIDGGSGNILHAIRAWGGAWEATAVNTDSALQAWMVGLQYEAVGFDGPGVLRFAFTPRNQMPTEAWVKAHEDRIDANARKLLEYMKRPADETNLAWARDLGARGRFIDHPLDARQEQTFVYGGLDLTTAPSALPDGRTLPPPPSVPPTDAPRIDRPLAFTRQPDFGRSLLEAGADPTGEKPSDDAFARLMFGMTRAQVQAKLDAIEQAYRGIEAGDDAAEAWRTIGRLYDELHPPIVDERGRPTRRRVEVERLEIPAGRFRLERPLVLLNVRQMFGAGPDRTTLFTERPIKLIELHKPMTIGNFAAEGGRVGLAVTGEDHHTRAPATLKSYVAGGSFYNIAFRGQSFAGVQIGRDDPTRMGGAEFDQNRFVGLSFDHTGDYGIYINAGMLDKWLCLQGRFTGQRKAGIAVPFNNLIHGAVIDCDFTDIAGPGLDFAGGNPRYLYRPWCVMVDQCRFIECGSADQPAVEQGHGELMSFTHSLIRTRDKTIATGYRGAAQIYEDLTLDVRVPDGAPAMMLRGVRAGLTARANGHTLRNVAANAPLAFINDANDRNDMFAASMAAYGLTHELDWDANPAAHENAPQNGWVHPFVLYDCRFGERRYGYALLNVDPEAGRVIQTIDLGGLAE